MKKGNMYPWAKPWNPLGGACPHQCAYCSTNKLKRLPMIADKYSGEIRLFSDLFKLRTIKENIVFVCAQNDLFAHAVPLDLIYRVLKECKKYPNHTYFFQTKNPERIKQFAVLLSPDSILCTTIETNRCYPHMGKTPDPIERARAMEEHRLAGFKTQVTIEPIMDFDLDDFVALLKIASPDKINLGADSKHNHLPEPSKDKLLALIDELQKFTTIERKTNLTRLLK